MKNFSIARLFIGTVLFFTLLPGMVLATPILGSKLYVQETGEVTLKFLGSDAGYDSWLFLNSPDVVNNIFHNHQTPVGTVFNLGSYAAGTELIFGIHVLDTDKKYYTGPASRNPDNVIHALVDDMYAPNTTRVGFEDLFGGGDLDYNDVEFAFYNVGSDNPVPEPATFLLMGSGLLGLGIWRYRNSRNS